MNERPDLGKPESLEELLARRAEERLTVALRAIDRETRRYALKKAGKLPWTRFELPELRDAA